MKTIKLKTTTAPKVYFSDGAAKKYYLGRWFNLGDGIGGDRMMKCYMIEAL